MRLFVSHPGRKDKDAPRMGHPASLPPTSQNRDIHPTDEDLSAGTPGHGAPGVMGRARGKGATREILDERWIRQRVV